MSRAHRTRPARGLRGRGSALTGALLLGLALTGCGSGGAGGAGSAIDPAMTSPQPGDVVQDDVHNAQDVAFAGDMIVRHRQALEMATLAKGRTGNDKVLALAQQIQSEQTPEVEEMTRWLTEWRKPVPGPSTRVTGAPGGVVSATDLGKLKAAKDATFDRTFLTLMIAHHEGAVLEARDEQRTGADERARGLAEDMAASQSTQLTEMRRLLG